MIAVKNMSNDYRFDNRSKETFKKDIKFSTMLEVYLFNEWIDRVTNTSDYILESYDNNGVDNNGEFIDSGQSTLGADFIVTMSKGKNNYENLPLEMKWVPTAGKFTLKKNDLKAYRKENAAILFIYNTVNCGLDLRKPKDYDLENHIKKIESKEKHIKWGIMFPEIVEKILNLTDRFRPIQYMGMKQGIQIKSSEFNNFFEQYDWI